MPDMRVHRHGDRWAVAERSAESPVKEFPSREAAELAARQMAAGGTVEVDDEDPTGLDAVLEPEAGEPVDTARDKTDPTDTPERSRSIQPGL